MTRKGYVMSMRHSVVGLAVLGLTLAFANATALAQSDQDDASLSPKARRVSKELRQSKNAFMAAVGACERPGLCDPDSKTSDRESTRLLLSSEDRFMSLCQLCATRDDCESERQRMRSGKRSRGVAPCH
jgi:hypothetical protein